MSSLIAPDFIDVGCSLADLTDLPRVGFRGAHSAEYLKGRGFVLPHVPNTAERQATGGWVARLSQTEYLLLGCSAEEEDCWVQDERTNYLLPRQDSHAWLQLRGEARAAVMAKLCGVDLSPEAFAPGSVAQTSAARISVIVVNAGDCFEILFDRPSLAYFRDAVVDAMGEFL